MRKVLDEKDQKILIPGTDAPHHVHHLLLDGQQVRVPQHGLPPHRQAHSSRESDDVTV